MSRTPTVHSSVAARSHGLFRIPRQILHRIRRRASARQLKLQLMKLDDRTLLDIGVTRAELVDLKGKPRAVSRRKR